MIRDRGNIKWVSMMLPEHVQQLKEFAKETNKQTKPILDEQAYEQFDTLVYEAWIKKRTLRVTYDDNGTTKTVQGTIARKNELEKQLQMVAEDTTHYKIPLQRIIDMENADDN